MDPRDYVLHNRARSSATQYDPVHAATGSWAQPNPPPSRASTIPWQHPPRPSPSLHRIPALMTGSDPYQIPSNGLPPPHSVFYGAPGDFPGSTPQHFHHPYGPLPMGRHGQESSDPRSGEAFIHQIPGPERPVSFPPPVGMGMLPAGSNHEPNSLPHPSLPLSSLSTTGFAQNHNTPPFSLPPPGPINPTPPRRGHYPLSAPSARPPRDVQSASRSNQSVPPRRSQPRIRRSMSTSRPLDFMEEDEEEITRQFLESLRANGSLDGHPLDDHFLRQIQLVRGGRDLPQVASRKTIQSLQSVEIETLEESDRVCVICYNEFGSVSPEGINEAPLRLPKCKHIFGDHCIKKWFENSDKCPYCRDKVPSEPKQVSSPSRAFLTLMRMRAQHSLRNSENDPTVRDTTRTTSVERESGNRQNQTGERRSPPEDAGEQRRRTRPRRGENSHDPTASASSTDPAGLAFPSAPFTRTPPSAPLSTPFPPAPTIPHPPVQRRMGPRPPGPTQQRTRPHPALSWENPGVASIRAPPSSMDGSAPSFYPQGRYMDYRPLPRSGQLDLPGSPSPLSPMLPNPLQSASDLTQERREQQRETANSSRFSSQPVDMSVQPSDGGQPLVDQDNRNRPW